MNAVFLRKVLFPLYHFLKKTNVINNLKELKQTQYLEAKQLQKLQQRKLLELLHHAYKNVPYYKQIFSDLGIKSATQIQPEILYEMPFLTKKLINENQRALLATNVPTASLIPNSTSGSTGEALRFFTDKRSWAFRRAVVIRNEEWLGVSLGDRRASLWGAPMDIKRAQKIRGRIHAWLNNIITLSSYDLNQKKMEEYVIQLNNFQPILLISYPGPLSILAEYMLNENLSPPDSLNAIISSAETLYSWQKKLIESAFKCPVYNRYGCREFGSIAQECTVRSGLHINVERVFMEVIDENGNPTPCEHTGELIITDLDNYGMPLIRYKIGDRGSLASENCPCGLSLPLLHNIDGRILDVIKTPNGNNLGGTFWTILFRSRPGIRNFQVIQKELEGVTIKYIKENGIDPPLTEFKKKILEKTGKNFFIKFEEVQNIPKTPSGKTRFVISYI